MSSQPLQSLIAQLHKVIVLVESHPAYVKAMDLNKKIEKYDIFKFASSMTYLTLLSLVPCLAVIFSLITAFQPIVGDESPLFLELRGLILHHLAAGSGEQVVKAIESSLENINAANIGLTGIAGVMVSLIFILRQIEIAFNRIFEVSVLRSALARFVHFWTFVSLSSVILALSFGIISGFDLQSLNPFGRETLQQGVSLFKAFTPVFATIALFGAMFKLMPNMKVSWRSAIIAAVVTGLVMSLAGGFYGWFATNFTKYKLIYGAMAAIPLFLFWIYINWLITLFGCLLCAEIHRKGSLSEYHFLKMEPHLSLYLKSYLPMACLLTVVKNFQSPKPKSISMHDLSIILGVPLSWVKEAAEFLFLHHFLHRDEESVAQEETRRKLYPSVSTNMDVLKEQINYLDPKLAEWNLNDESFKNILKNL